MPEEVTTPPVTPEAPATPAPAQVTPPELQPERLRPAAQKTAELGDEAMEAFRGYYEEKGGTYFKKYDEKLSQLEQRMNQRDCELAVKDAIIELHLTPEQAKAIRGATPDEIREHAKLIASIGPAKAEAPAGSAPPAAPALPTYEKAPENSPEAQRRAVYGGIQIIGGAKGQ